jgi:hypothetical protein
VTGRELRGARRRVIWGKDRHPNEEWVVSQIVRFFTETGDAWLLDASERFAPLDALWHEVDSIPAFKRGGKKPAAFDGGAMGGEPCRLAELREGNKKQVIWKWPKSARYNNPSEAYVGILWKAGINPLPGGR